VQGQGDGYANEDMKEEDGKGRVEGEEIWERKSKHTPTDCQGPQELVLISGLLGKQPTGDVSHKRSSRLPLPSATPAVTFPASESNEWVGNKIKLLVFGIMHGNHEAGRLTG